MAKGLGKFLRRGSKVLGIGGKDLENCDLYSGQLITSNELPDQGIYEVQQLLYKCDYPGCGHQSVRIRRVNMRYLTRNQRNTVTDISAQSRGSSQI